MICDSNHNRVRRPSLLGLVGLGAAAASLSGCGVDYASNDTADFSDYHKTHPIILAQAPFAVDVFPVGGRLDPLSQAKVKAFAERYRELGSGRITILAPSLHGDAQGAVVGEIRRTLYATGVRGYVSVGSYPVADPALASPIRLVFQGLRAKVATRCGQWPSDLTSASSLQGWKNEPYENYGCATQSMLAAQVDDPRDLEQQRASGPPDEEMRLRAIGDVRKGQDPGTDWKVQTTTIGTVGSGG